MKFDYTKPIDENAPTVYPKQKYHSETFRGDRICEDMEDCFRRLYAKHGDFHIIDLQPLHNGSEVLFVYAVPS